MDTDGTNLPWHLDAVATSQHRIAADASGKTPSPMDAHVHRTVHEAIAQAMEHLAGRLRGLKEE